MSAQTTENQKFEILKFADEKKFTIVSWLGETVSGTKKVTDRKLGESLQLHSLQTGKHSPQKGEFHEETAVHGV